MAKVIEYTLVSADSVFEDPAALGFMGYRDDAYLRDGLGLLASCDAMLMGRTSYEANAKIWPARSDHPWAGRINAMKKYVFSSTLTEALWDNTAVIADDPIVETDRLKAEHAGDLLVWGHTRFAESLMRGHLVDVLDLSIHPLLVGAGKSLFRPGLNVALRLTAVKAFSSIVKLTYEPQYR